MWGLISEVDAYYDDYYEEVICHSCLYDIDTASSDDQPLDESLKDLDTFFRYNDFRRVWSDSSTELKVETIDGKVYTLKLDSKYLGQPYIIGVFYEAISVSTHVEVKFNEESKLIAIYLTTQNDGVVSIWVNNPLHSNLILEQVE